MTITEEFEDMDKSRDLQKGYSRKDAFAQAVERCKASLAEAQGGSDILKSSVDMASLVSTIKSCQAKYECKKQSKARKWLSRFSERVVLYGNILDVLIQHHPEYVSLAWGAFKLVFQGIVNHETLTKQLCKALCRIADALPLAEQKLLLHPTDTMSALMTDMYIHIFQFTERALHWYGRSRLKHAIMAFTHPFELHFKDIVDEIYDISRRINEIALTMTMSEVRQLRPIRLELQELRKAHEETQNLALEMKKALEKLHDLQHIGLLDTNKRVCDIQLSQIMCFTDATSLMSPEMCLEYFKIRRNRRRANDPGQYDALIDATQLHAWGNSFESSWLVISGSIETQHVVRDFAANLIELVRNAGVPIIWLLNTPEIARTTHSISDAIRYLLSQILKQNRTLLNERSATLTAVRFQSATTPEDWMKLLGSVLDGLPQLYIILGVDVLERCVTSESKLWSDRFRELFSALASRGVRVTVRVAFLCTRSSHRLQLGDLQDRELFRIPSDRRGGIRKSFLDNRRGTTRRKQERLRKKLMSLPDVTR